MIYDAIQIEFRTTDYLRLKREDKLHSMRIGMTKEEAIGLVVELEKIIEDCPDDHLVFHTIYGRGFTT